MPFCPRCHNRGVVRFQAYCDCPVGTQVLALDRVRERLATIWTPRTIDFWLRTHNPDLGGLRPVDTIAQGGVDDVLAAIERLPGTPASANPSVAPDRRIRGETAAVVPIPTIPDPPDAIRRVLATQFRRAGKFRMAAALELGTTQDLTPAERQALDAAIQGRQAGTRT